MKKILKKISFIIVTLLIIYITKQNVIYGVGLVYQAWAEDSGSLYFRTFTTPYKSVLSDYRGYSKTGSTLTTSISPTGWFYNYKDTSSAGRTSKWVYSSNESELLADKPSDKAFSTRKLRFHTSISSTYTASSSGKYSYTKINSDDVTKKDLNSIENIYGDSSASSRVSFNDKSDTTKYSIAETSDYTTLYRMTLIAIASGNTNPVYVADRVINSSQVNSIKGYLANITYNGATYKNAIYVSQSLGYSKGPASSWGSSNVTIADTPEQFVYHETSEGGSYNWGDSTHGLKTKALGSALNLYDNILMFPTDISRYITVKHINIGTDQTVTQSNRSDVKETDPNNEDIKTEESYSKKNYGTYLGYNMVTADTSSTAEKNMNAQAANGIANKGDTCTVSAYNGKKDQYVIIEMYYNNKPQTPEQGKTMTVIPRYIIYDENSSEVVKVIKGDEKQITKDSATVSYKSDIGAIDGNAVTYTGDYEVVNDDAAIPENKTGTTKGNDCTVNFDKTKDIVYVNFKYTVSAVQRTVYVRDICYSSTGIVLSSSLRSVKIENNGSTSINYQGATFNGCSYVGYIALYDKSMPSCYAYVDKTSYTVDGSKVRTGTCINFMYQKTGIAETSQESPKQKDEGYLSISDLNVSDKISGSGNNNDTSVIKQTSILSVPCGETIRIGMKDLRKYYIAGIRTKEEIKESEAGGSLTDITNWSNNLFNNDNEKETHMTFSLLHIILVKITDVNYPNDFTRTKITPYYDKYNYIIPYKYIKYDLDKAAIYELQKSSIYTPQGNGNDQTYGDKILDNAVFNVFSKRYSTSEPKYDVYSESDNVDIGVNKIGNNVIKVLALDANATFTIKSSELLGTMPTNIIKVINEDGGDGGYYGNIQESSINKLATSAATTTITNLLGNIDSDSTDTINNIMNILNAGTTDAVILETIPAYTNVSTERKSFFEAMGVYFKCTTGTVLSLIGFDPLNWVGSCADIPAATQGFLDWWKSLKKTAVYVYTAQDLSGAQKWYLGNIDSSYTPGISIRKEVDSLRIIEKTFTLGTSSKNAILKLSYKDSSGNQSINIAQTQSIYTSVSSAFADILETIGSNISELFGIDSLISQKRISDLNFTETSGNTLTNWLSGIFNTPRTFNYLFDGWVCVYDASSGMSVTNDGKSAYINGFGDKIQGFSTSPKNYIQEKIKLSNLNAGDDEKIVNGIRAFSEVTTYKGLIFSGSNKKFVDTTETFIDNIFWSNLNIIGSKNVFTYNKNTISMNHNVHNEKVDAVNVYTPVKLDISTPQSDDQKLISQIEDLNLPPILNSNQFYFYVSAKDYAGVYGGLLSSKINKYIEKYVLTLSFNAEKITFGGITKNDVKAGQRVEILNDSSYYESGTEKIKVTVKADGELNGAQAYTVRAIAKNMTSSIFNISYKNTYDEFFDLMSNICNNPGKDISLDDGPVYYDEKIQTIESEVVDRLYDFRITDVKDIDWQDIFRVKGLSTHSGISYYTGLRKYDLVSGMLKRTKLELGNTLSRTLPIGPYKSIDSTYVKAPKLGYRISFDIKLSGQYSTATDASGNFIRNINITPSFYCIKKDGTGYTTAIDLYYKNSSGEYISINNYGLTYIPKDGLRLLSEDDEDGNLSSEVQSLGNPASLVLKPNTMTTGQSGGNYQTYYGEYKLPNSTIAVPSGKTPNEKNKITNAYIGVIFNMKSKFVYSGNTYILSYSKNMDRYTNPADNPAAIEDCNSSEWEYEGYLKQQYNKPFTSAKIQLEKGIWYITNDARYEAIKGTVVLFDLDARASTDFE